jgi:hypothetical protein
MVQLKIELGYTIFMLYGIHHHQVSFTPDFIPAGAAWSICSAMPRSMRSTSRQMRSR